MGNFGVSCEGIFSSNFIFGIFSLFDISKIENIKSQISDLTCAFCVTIH